MALETVLPVIVKGAVSNIEQENLVDDAAAPGSIGNIENGWRFLPVSKSRSRLLIVERTVGSFWQVKAVQTVHLVSEARSLPYVTCQRTRSPTHRESCRDLTNPDRGLWPKSHRILISNGRMLSLNDYELYDHQCEDSFLDAIMWSRSDFDPPRGNITTRSDGELHTVEFAEGSMPPLSAFYDYPPSPKPTRRPSGASVTAPSKISPEREYPMTTIEPERLEDPFPLLIPNDSERSNEPDNSLDVLYEKTMRRLSHSMQHSEASRAEILRSVNLSFDSHESRAALMRMQWDAQTRG